MTVIGPLALEDAGHTLLMSWFYLKLETHRSMCTWWCFDAWTVQKCGDISLKSTRNIPCRSLPSGISYPYDICWLPCLLKLGHYEPCNGSLEVIWKMNSHLENPMGRGHPRRKFQAERRNSEGRGWVLLHLFCGKSHGSRGWSQRWGHWGDALAWGMSSLEVEDLGNESLKSKDIP